MLTSGNVAAQILAPIVEIIYALRVEMIVFFCSLLLYGLLGQPRVRRAGTEPATQAPSAKNICQAFAAGDHRSVLKCWNIWKKDPGAEPVDLNQVVMALQKFKPDASFIAREITTFFKKHTLDYGMDEYNDLLDGLGRRCDSELLERLVEQMPSHLSLDARSYEILLQLHFMLRDFARVHDLAAQMKAAGFGTSRAHVVLLKTALKEADLEACLRAVGDLRTAWSSVHGLDQLLPHLALLAAKEHQTGRLLSALGDAALTLEVLQVVLPACRQEHREDLVIVLHKRMLESGQQDAPTSAARLRALGVLNPTAAVEHVRSIVAAFAWTPELATAALAACKGDLELAKELYGMVAPTEMPVRGAFLRGLLDLDLADEACDIFEPVVLSGSRVDARTEKLLLSAALKANRAALSARLIGTPSDVGKSISLIRQCTADKNVGGARAIFDAAEAQGEGTVVLSNALLDHYVTLNALDEAEQWMATAAERNVVDVVSYNTLLKGFVSQGPEGLTKAMHFLDKMGDVLPNTVTFNQLLNAIPGEQSLLDQMKKRGIPPNQVTASILLKSINRSSSEESVKNVLDVVGRLEDQVDEILLSSLIEACVRIRKPRLLSEYLAKYVPASPSFGAHTFGSLIKAYGFVGDAGGVWRSWKEMRARRILPTAVTIGCMLEAVVTTGDSDGAYELLQSLEKDSECAPLLNSVIYCSVLKGFARERRVDRVFQIYNSMKARQVPISIALFNAAIDACARSQRMDKVPWLEKEMLEYGITPTLITYSTLIKGYAGAGDSEKAFAVLDRVKKARLQPDEIMYNSLLDVCAQSGDLKAGLLMLEEMQKSVKLSNFTLSVVIKMCSRCRKLDQAFTLAEELERKHKLKRNEHVWANLIQACIYGRSLPRAWEVFTEMIQAGVSPLPRTYSFLLRHYYQQSNATMVAHILRVAYGLRKDLPHTGYHDAKQTARCKLEVSVCNEALQKLTTWDENTIAEELFCDLAQTAKVRLNRQVAMRSLARAAPNRRWNA